MCVCEDMMEGTFSREYDVFGGSDGLRLLQLRSFGHKLEFSDGSAMRYFDLAFFEILISECA